MIKLAGLIVLAQLSAEPPVNVPRPPPPSSLMSPEEMTTIRSAIDHLKEQGLDVNYGVVEQLGSAIRPRQLPMIGFALSRSSNDPKACALLKRIEPSAVCMK